MGFLPDRDISAELGPYSAVVALPEVLKSALKACSEVTGWVIQVVAAGPYGLANGDIWRQEYVA